MGAMCTFAIGALSSDLVLYMEHRMSHDTHRGGLARTLHINRHHATYPTDLRIRAGIPSTHSNLLPDITDFDLSALSALWPPLILAVTGCYWTAIGAACALTWAFTVHAVAHQPDLPCVWGYRAFHCRHHDARTCNFGVASPLFDVLFGTYR